MRLVYYGRPLRRVSATTESSRGNHFFQQQRLTARHPTKIGLVSLQIQKKISDLCFISPKV